MGMDNPEQSETYRHNSCNVGLNPKGDFRKDDGYSLAEGMDDFSSAHVPGNFVGDCIVHDHGSNFDRMGHCMLGFDFRIVFYHGN